MHSQVSLSARGLPVPSSTTALQQLLSSSTSPHTSSWEHLFPICWLCQWCSTEGHPGRRQWLKKKKKRKQEKVVSPKDLGQGMKGKDPNALCSAIGRITRTRLLAGKLLCWGCQSEISDRTTLCVSGKPSPFKGRTEELYMPGNCLNSQQGKIQQQKSRGSW